MRPAVGRVMPVTIRPSVDLPQPDLPTRPSTSPRRTREIDGPHRTRHRDVRPAPDQAEHALGQKRLPGEAAAEARGVEDRVRGHAAASSGSG